MRDQRGEKHRGGSRWRLERAADKGHAITDQRTQSTSESLRRIFRTFLDFFDFQIFWTTRTQQRTATCSVESAQRQQEAEYLDTSLVLANAAEAAVVLMSVTRVAERRTRLKVKLSNELQLLEDVMAICRRFFAEVCTCEAAFLSPPREIQRHATRGRTHDPLHRERPQRWRPNIFKHLFTPLPFLDRKRRPN